ncbi:aldehyde ferredoxin oxidoreductase family protein [uncultured Desulfosarcina sp.]|uniref:aldehyde ferredoxin oxidoreductase family protein n=1 Tax=uncultured Desulfosarcina sp. TaxID=218289 RepID=UPI0029C8FEFF|nr:aldehyde ferredoxin oxidoreductase family protein [uncultured Desulfosarcina sp.]
MANPKGGHFGRILEIDLTAQKYKTLTIDEKTCRRYLGGCGMGSYLLFQRLKPKHDPMAADSPIFMGVGPLSGTACASTRCSFVNKSPYTGLLSHAEVGSFIGNELKWAGWDGILVTGKSKKPVYLYVRNDKVEFKDASKLWGKDTHVTEESILDELKDTYVKVASIGPGGENEVGYSAVMVERFRAAARTGTGALMGNKKLKAIAIRGTKYVPVVDRETFHKVAEANKQFSINKEGWQGIKRWGTAGLLELKHHVTGSLVTKNYQTTWYPDIEEIGAEQANRRFWKKHSACYNCPNHCMKLGVIRGGDYDGLIAEGPEYETGGLLGSNLGLADFDLMMAAIELCDAMGLDSISAGGSIGFAMEAFQRGLLTADKFDGMTLEWGDGEAAIELIRKIAYKEGQAGKFLAKGVSAMAKELGGNAADFACVVKGKEMAAHDPRGDKPRGVSYAMGTCGGDHHEGNSPAGQAQRCLHNSLVICSFIGGYWAPKMFVDMLNPLCGWDMDEAELMATARRIRTLERCFNVREGTSRKDDTLPKRMLTEPLPEGPKKGSLFSPEEMKKVQDDYYAYFGWDDNGIPTEKTLKELGLEFAIGDVKAAA